MCKICDDSLFMHKFQQNILNDKYSKYFTFFFSNPVDELLEDNFKMKHVLLFHDYEVYDNEEFDYLT